MHFLTLKTGGTLAATALTLLLAACGGSGGGGGIALPSQALSCTQLNGMAIADTAIGLPTSGAVLTATQQMAAGGTGATATGAYCLASGEIKPVDSKAPSIKFQVALPDGWNGKVLMRGGGGWNGNIPAVAGNLLNSASLSPLARGYAVFASDSGHQSTVSTDASFAANPEALRNWIGDALKKTRDAALAVVVSRYAAAPSKSYFVGSSTGGREALTVAGRWPADWDGVVSLYPSEDATVQILAMMAEARALAAPGAYMSQAKRGALFRAALQACDRLDGLADDIIGNVPLCNASFRPATALLDGAPLRCAGGADTGDSCLSDAQLAALDKINSSLQFGFLNAPDNSFPGYNVYTSDTGIPGSSPLAPTLAALGFGLTAPGTPVTATMLAGLQYADSFVRYAIVGDPNANILNIDPLNPGALGARFAAFAAQDAGHRDLLGFASKGGKLLLMHGTADMLVSARRSENYVQQLRARMGDATVAAFLRFYEVPGFGHSVSSQFNVAWDQLGALEGWVEQGTDPASNQTVTDTLGVPGRTRPLCLFPGWPKYKGAGDVNSAASFSCATN